MNTPMLNKALGGALVVQTLLIGVMWWPRSSGTGEARDLIPVDVAMADEVTLYGRTSPDEVPEKPLVLKRSGEDWLISSAFDYPADREILDEDLFGPFDTLIGRLAVAEKDYSHAALDVGESNHAHKLVVRKGDETTTVYLGQTEGKAVNARVEGEDAVYKVRGFSAGGLPDRATRVFDRDFLKTPVDIVTSMTIERPGQPPIRLAHDGVQWTLEGLEPGRTLDEKKVRGFIQSTLNLRMLEPHGTAVVPEMGFDQGVRVTWTMDQDGTSSTNDYRIGSEIAGESGRVYVKVADLPWVFEVLEGNTQHARERPIDEMISDIIDLDELEGAP